MTCANGVSIAKGPPRCSSVATAHTSEQRRAVRQDLDRHVAIPSRVLRSVNLAQPAGAQDLIRAESGAGGEGQTVGLYGRSVSAEPLFPARAFIVTNLPLANQAVVRFYNKRG